MNEGRIVKNNIEPPEALDGRVVTIEHDIFNTLNTLARCLLMNIGAKSHSWTNMTALLLTRYTLVLSKCKKSFNIWTSTSLQVQIGFTHYFSNTPKDKLVNWTSHKHICVLQLYYMVRYVTSNRSFVCQQFTEKSAESLWTDTTNLF